MSKLAKKLEDGPVAWLAEANEVAGLRVEAQIAFQKNAQQQNKSLSELETQSTLLMEPMSKLFLAKMTLDGCVKLPVTTLAASFETRITFDFQLWEALRLQAQLNDRQPVTCELEACAVIPPTVTIDGGFAAVQKGDVYTSLWRFTVKTHRHIPILVKNAEGEWVLYYEVHMSQRKRSGWTYLKSFDSLEKALPVALELAKTQNTEPDIPVRVPNDMRVVHRYFNPHDREM